MNRKPCSRCALPADFSLAFLVSTIGIRPRGQKCTQTVPFCKSCIREILPALASTPLQDLRQPLRDAYTALEGVSHASSSGFGPSPAAGEPHQGGVVAVSCRSCLTACNSRRIWRGKDGFFEQRLKLGFVLRDLCPACSGPNAHKCGHE